MRRLWRSLPDEEESTDAGLEPQSAVSTRENLAESFLDKRLQVRFEVPLPVLSDWRSYLLKLLNRALPSHDQAEFHAVYRQYASHVDKLGITPTPRDLKLYVNGIGALHRKRPDEFPLAHLGYYYLLRRDGIDLAKHIREGKIPTPEVERLLGENVADHLAALLFGVDAELAKQLLLRDPIEQALRTGNADDLLELSRYTGGFLGGSRNGVCIWLARG